MTRNKQTIEMVTVSEQRRRRWSTAEKAALANETYEPGTSVSLVARKHGVGASQLFSWRKFKGKGELTAVSAGESAVLASELAAARTQIAQLQRMLGKNTIEAEILKETVESAREKSGLRARPYWVSTTNEPVCSALGVARSQVSQMLARPVDWADGRTTQTFHQPADSVLVDAVSAEITALPTYCYRHAGAVVNRTRDDGAVSDQPQAFCRLMKASSLLLPKAPKHPVSSRVHDGIV
jgi:transposase-like protein